MNVPLGVGNDEVGTVAMSVAPYMSSGEYLNWYLPSEPIDCRAWTFQESYVSRRMLMYCNYQLYWVCGELFGQDGGSRNYLPSTLARQTTKRPTPDDWIKIVRQYSSRVLTDPSDKLPALSGIAEYFGRRLNDTYLAGLWTTRLHYELCWYGSGLQRPPEWRAPSWSFLSVDGTIDFMSKTDLNFGSQVSRTDAGFSIQGYNVTPLSQEAPFGKVASAVLRLRGKVLQVENILFFQSSASDAKCDRPTILNMRKRARQIGGRLRFDTTEMSADSSSTILRASVEPLDRSSSLYCLMTGTTHHQIRHQAKTRTYYTTEYRPWGLLLAKVSGQYTRVGYFRGDSVYHFRKVLPETIEIV